MSKQGAGLVEVEDVAGSEGAALVAAPFECWGCAFGAEIGAAGEREISRLAEEPLSIGAWARWDGLHAGETTKHGEIDAAACCDGLVRPDLDFRPLLDDVSRPHRGFLSVYGELEISTAESDDGVLSEEDCWAGEGDFKALDARGITDEEVGNCRTPKKLARGFLRWMEEMVETNFGRRHHPWGR